MTDLHIADKGRAIWDTDTLKNFDLAIKMISQINDVDAIIITGDLSDDGSVWSYKYIDKAFDYLKIPTFICPGNHDNLDSMHSLISNNYIRCESQITLGNWNFILLNSIVFPYITERRRYQPYGLIAEEELRMLREKLCDETKPTVIALHHPAINPGNWFSKKLLSNDSIFRDTLKDFPCVKMVLYGHFHYNFQLIENGILHSIAPAIGFAYNKDLAKYEIARGEEGFNIIELGNDIAIKSILINNDKE